MTQKLAEILQNGEATLFHNRTSSQIKFKDDVLEINNGSIHLKYDKKEFEKELNFNYIPDQMHSHMAYEGVIKNTLNEANKSLADIVDWEHETIGSLDRLAYSEKVMMNVAKFFISVEYLLKGKSFKNEFKNDLIGTKKIKENYTILKKCIEYGKNMLEDQMKIERDDKSETNLLKAWYKLQNEINSTYSILLGVQDNILKAKERRYEFFFGK